MKKILSLTSALSLFLLSCGNKSDSIDDLVASKDLESIRAKRSEITAQLKALDAKIQLLDSAISELDDNAKLPLVSVFEAKPEKFDILIKSDCCCL